MCSFLRCALAQKSCCAVLFVHLISAATWENHAAHSSSIRNDTSCSLLQWHFSRAPNAANFTKFEPRLAYWNASTEEIHRFVVEELPELRHLTQAQQENSSATFFTNPSQHNDSFLSDLAASCDAPMSYSNTDKAKSWYSEKHLKQVSSDLNLLPRTDLGDSGEPFPRYNQCAVVSSSGRMLHHSHGADIDAHDFVIRFNTAPVKGFEKHVGGKTSMRILNHWIQKPWVDIWTYQAEKSPLPAMLNASYPLLDEQSFQVLQTFPWEFPDSSVVQNYLSIRKNHPEIRYHMTSSTLFRFMNESLGFVNPTAGMVGVVIGLQICKHVDVYELLPSKAAIETYHYWEDRGIVFCPHHCQVEHNFLRKYNTLPSAASEATGVVRLSASVHPELRFCLPKVPGLAMPINE